MSDFNLGTVTAYGYAKDKGYTGTEDEFAELMASYADVAEQAAESATQAAASATTATTKAGEAFTSATTATNKATEATTAATTATGKATEAAGSATTATTKAGEASTSATNAAASATRAQEILDSIPADYSQLSEDVEDLKDGLSDKTNDIEHIADMILPYTGKFLVPSPLIADQYIDVDNNGVLKRYVGWSATQYVALDGAETMYIPSSLGRYHAFYADKTIESFVSATGTGNISIPSTAKYVRFSFSNNYVGELDKVSTNKYGYDSVLVDAITSTKSGLNSAERWSSYNNDANNLLINKIYQITYSTGVANLPVTPFSGTVLTFDFEPDSSSSGAVQLAFKNSGEVYKRLKWGTNWRDWYQVVTADMLHSSLNTAYKGLGNFVACGDSITVSLSYPTSGNSKHVKSWATSFAELCGSQATIYAQGGRSTVDFLASEDYPLAVADTSQFAFLFLGINDINESVGVETFTSNYTTIVNALLTNHKFVFCINIPYAIQSSSQRSSYNEAIASVCNSISKAFLVDITGCTDRIAVYKNYGHLSSIGYAVLAGEIADAVNATMNANDYFDAQIDIDSY